MKVAGLNSLPAELFLTASADFTGLRLPFGEWSKEMIVKTRKKDARLATIDNS